MLDSQTVKTCVNVPLSGQGIDAGKRIIGRKRHLGTDALGPLPTVALTAAGVGDTAAGQLPLTRFAAARPRVTKAWVDAGHREPPEDGGRKGEGQPSPSWRIRPAKAARSAADGSTYSRCGPEVRCGGRAGRPGTGRRRISNRRQHQHRDVLGHVTR
ncbi:transposase [Streptomyces misionensis]